MMLKMDKKSEYTKFISRSLKDFPLRAILNLTYPPYEYEYPKFISHSLKEFPFRANLNSTYSPYF